MRGNKERSPMCVEEDNKHEDQAFIQSSPGSQVPGSPVPSNVGVSKNDSKYFLIIPDENGVFHIPKDKLPPGSSEFFQSNRMEVISEGYNESVIEDERKEVENEILSKIAEIKENETVKNLICVYSNFFDDLFWRCIGAGCRVISPFLMNLSDDPFNDTQRMKRHLYTISMRDLVICFTGFRDRDAVMLMGRLVTAMGGSCREQMSCTVTHLIAPSANGIKYRCALTSKIPVVSCDWIHEAWKLKDDPEYFRAGGAANLTKQFLVLPFYGCRLKFFGFNESTLDELVHQTEINGGKVFSGDEDHPPTHAVVNEPHCRGTATAWPYPENCEVVRLEWFWTCLQKRILEKPDAFRVNTDSLVTSPPSSNRNNSSFSEGVLTGENTPQRPRRSSHVSTRNQRRSRQAEFNERLIQLAQLSTDSLNSPMHSIIGRDSISYTSILDATVESVGTDTENNELIKSPLLKEAKVSKTPDSSTKRKYTPRYGKVMELIHTESNYVGILECMAKIIRPEILDTNQAGGPILSERDAEVVFRDIDPLLDVHTSLKAELLELGKDEVWANDRFGETVEVGTIMLRHLEAIKRVYPPFVNFYDQRKETVEDLAKKYSRFHAYLRRCQSRKETGRNSIIDLMIRPVQRLPSMMLILQDLLKHTNESYRDHFQLGLAIKELKSVLSSINEDKRRTEGFLAVFNVIHAIDGCPPDLASSHRQYLGQVDVVEVTDKLVEIGQGLTLFLFSDQLEICRRKRAANISRNGSIRNTANSNAAFADDMSIMSGSVVSIPAAVAATQGGYPPLPSTPGPSMGSASTASVGHGNSKKSYKHVMMIALADVECTTDLRKDVGSDDDYRAFALVLKRKNADTTNDVYAFAVTDETDKLTFLRMIAQQILITTCKNGTADCLINEMTPGTFNIDIEEAFKRHTLSGKAKRLRQKVSKALSFSRTPRKMKRAVSHLPSYGMGSMDPVYAHMDSPSTLDLRDSSASMDATFTPSLAYQNTAHSVSTLTPTGGGSTPRHRVSAFTLNSNVETFRETSGVDPDALFQTSPPTPEHPNLASHTTGRPSVVVRLKQHLTNVCRRSLSNISVRHSLAPTVAVDETIDRKKRARITSMFSQNSFNGRTTRSRTAAKPVIQNAPKRSKRSERSPRSQRSLRSQRS